MPKLRLSENAIAKLVPGERQVTYFDQAPEGHQLLLVVNKASRTFYGVYYVSGRMKTFKLGRHGDISLKEARRRCSEFRANPLAFMQREAEMREQLAFYATRSAEDVAEACSTSGGTSVATEVERFLSLHVEREGLISAREIRRQLENYVVPEWSTLPIVSIRKGDVAALLEKITMGQTAVQLAHAAKQKAKRQKPRLSQAQKVRVTLHTLFEWFSDNYDEDFSNPAKLKRRMKIVKRQRILDDEEVRALWQATNGGSQYDAIIRMCLLSAQRRQKVSTMKWEDVKDGVWSVATEKDAAGNSRQKGVGGALRLPRLALDIIAAQPRRDGNPYVFSSSKGGHFNSWSKCKADLDAKLAVPAWVVHDLRRTARSLLSRAGVRPDIGERVLGHIQQGVLGIYDRHQYVEEKALALKSLASLVETIVREPEPSTSNVTPLRAAA